MPKFINLTQSIDGKSVWINSDNVYLMVEGEKGSVIEYSDENISVKETPEEIIAMIDAVEGNGNSVPAYMPDWSKAPEWANWWAIDYNGSCYWYGEKPIKRNNHWFSGSQLVCKFPDWENSLQGRPKVADNG